MNSTIIPALTADAKPAAPAVVLTATDRNLAGREEVKCLNVARAHHSKVATVECRHFARAEALSCGDHRCVDGAKRKLVIARDQLRNAQDVRGLDRLQAHLAGSKVTEKSGLSLPAETTCDQVSDLCDDERGNDQRAGMSLQQLEARLVMSIVAVHVGVERPGVNDERYRQAPR